MVYFKKVIKIVSSLSAAVLKERTTCLSYTDHMTLSGGFVFLVSDEGRTARVSENTLSQVEDHSGQET